MRLRIRRVLDLDDSIAKLSSRSDPYPVVKAAAVAMELARRAGLTAAPTEVTEVLHHDVLLVERFDRTGGGRHRRLLVSALPAPCKTRSE